MPPAELPDTMSTTKREFTSPANSRYTASVPVVSSPAFGEVACTRWKNSCATPFIYTASETPPYMTSANRTSCCMADGG